MRDDAELIRRAKNGDREAFAELATRWRDLVYAAGYSVLGRRDDAEDVAQEALVRMFAKISSFREGASFPRWAWVVAKNAAIARLRSRARQVPPAHAPRAARSTASEIVSEVTDAVRELPDRLREAVVMYYINGYTSNEVAASLGVPDGTVRSRLTEARRILRGKLMESLRRTLSELVPRSELDALIARLNTFPPKEPDVQVTAVDAPLPDPDFKEGTGFFVPLEEDGAAFAAWYDYPGKRLSDASFVRVLGKAHIAGKRCWEVCMADSEQRKTDDCTLWYWSVGRDEIRMVGKYFSARERLLTAADEDWDEPAEGAPRRPGRLRVIERIGDEEFRDPENRLFAPVGTYDVSVGGRKHRCLRVMNVMRSFGILADFYINESGRTVLFRRYNCAPNWSERNMGNEDCTGTMERLQAAGTHRIVHNGVGFRHWYDCITDTAMQCAPPMIPSAVGRR